MLATNRVLYSPASFWSGYLPQWPLARLFAQVIRRSENVMGCRIGVRMSSTRRNVTDQLQALFPGRKIDLTIKCPRLSKLKPAIAQLVASTGKGVVGVGYTLGAEVPQLASLVLATPTRVLVISVFASSNNAKLAKILQDLACNTELTLFGADIEVVAYGLYNDIDCFISRGVDAHSIGVPGLRGSPEVCANLLGPEASSEVVARVLCRTARDPADALTLAIVKAVAYSMAAARPSISRRISLAPRVSTQRVALSVLEILAKIHRDGQCLESIKPGFQKNEVCEDVRSSKGTLVLHSERYQTRLRQTEQTVVLSDVDDNELTARVINVRGKQGTLAVDSAALVTKLKSVTTIGKDPLTNVERFRVSLLLQALQGTIVLDNNHAFRRLWGLVPVIPRAKHLKCIPDAVTVQLNESQQRAVLRAITPLPASGLDVQLICGPPGTGKTSVIAACVQALCAQDKPVWLISQSNVAVKNIAQKLASEDFWKFKILVSHGFHFNWHEHLYERIQKNVVVSDMFPKPREGVDRLLRKTRVLLCTIGMLSNPQIRDVGFTRRVPVETIIVDEASQIEVGDYLSPVHTFVKTLKRMVFVGDDKQLAPYGQDEFKDLDSIFELGTHHASSTMLDVSYRLPRPICSFISKHVYDKRLRSQHKTSRSRVAHLSTCQMGWRWLSNEREAEIAIAVASQLFLLGKTDFRIITPYDPQRALIEKKLKASSLPWEDRVFSVDSFQGNEAEHIIVSIARSGVSPGFMKNKRRTNVMLSRCKVSMFILSSKKFLGGAAKKTLVGSMAKEWGADGWINTQDVLSGRLTRD